MIAARLFAYAPLHIVEIKPFAQGKQGAGLPQHFGRAARGILPHTVGNDVFRRDHRNRAIGRQFNHLNHAPICQTTEQDVRDYLETQLELIEKVGLQNYLQSQMDE